MFRLFKTATPRSNCLQFQPDCLDTQFHLMQHVIALEFAFQTLKIVAWSICLSILPDSAHAQLNIGPQFVLPIEGIEKPFQWGYGAGFLMEIPVNKSVSMVGLFDFIHWVKDKKQEENLRLGHAGLQAGVRLYPNRKMYLQGWGGGYKVYSNKILYNPDSSGEDSEYGWAIGAGYLPNRRTDLGLRLQSIGPRRFLALRLDYRLGANKENEQAQKK